MESNSPAVTEGRSEKGNSMGLRNGKQIVLDLTHCSGWEDCEQPCRCRRRDCGNGRSAQRGLRRGQEEEYDFSSHRGEMANFEDESTGKKDSKI